MFIRNQQRRDRKAIVRARRSVQKRFIKARKADKSLQKSFKTFAAILDGGLKQLLAEARVGRRVAQSIRSRLSTSSSQEQLFVLGLEAMERKEIEKAGSPRV
ncbi:hypothetical protein MYU51_016021 [Penicillium brevicompactum]|uniref:uncharacterized protein n=1 Tax=Penicillium brevicompactum TaxID=5074 RepID=UPI00253FC4F7|nr:uncharacterized protein N7506_002768 [Penicillium brevicompactum]KAJ5342944.1 hypothetical protein N7506_002768 [Penicillium brevicompactum]